MPKREKQTPRAQFVHGLKLRARAEQRRSWAQRQSRASLALEAAKQLDHRDPWDEIKLGPK